MNAPGHVITNAAGGSRFASTFFHPDCTVGVGIPAAYPAGHRTHAILPYSSLTRGLIILVE
jgi:hypothetical protein